MGRSTSRAALGVQVARTQPGLLASMRVLPRMARAVRRGEYRPAVPRMVLALLTAGYVVSPVDLVPEVLLGPLGVADDVTLAVTVGAGLLAAEAARFLAWEQGEAGRTGAVVGAESVEAAGVAGVM